MKVVVEDYIHRVQYYETDGMRIAHHSNYIRWMEEARMDFLEQVGLAYDQLEERNLQFPVLSASCEYKQAVRFGDKVRIHLELEWFTGLRYNVRYRITDSDQSILHAVGETTHCFVDQNLKPVVVKRYAPDLYEVVCANAPLRKPPRLHN